MGNICTELIWMDFFYRLTNKFHILTSLLSGISFHPGIPIYIKAKNIERQNQKLENSCEGEYTSIGTN